MNAKWRLAASGMILATTLGACSAGQAPQSPDNDSEPSTGSSGNALGPDAVSKAGTGELTWCAQKDGAGAFPAIAEAINNPDSGVTINVLELPESTDEWRNQFVQRQQAGSDECDIFGADVVWTAEFAQRGFLKDLTPYVESRADQFIQSTLETVTYRDKYWGVPLGTNVALMYYRTDQVQQAPQTWQQAYADGQATDGLVYQGSAYEGLTVNFVTLSSAAGGKILSDDGTESLINSPENLEVLNFMVDGISDGSVPPAVLTYMEEESRRAFEAGKGSLMANWPYAYVLGQESAIAGKFDIAPLPEWEGGTASGVLGGVNLVVSEYSKNPELALKAIDLITNESNQILLAEKGVPPTQTAIYDDDAVKQALPFSAVLKTGVENATSRPVTPVYSQVSRAIYSNVSDALSGKTSPQQALEKADADIKAALETF